LVVRQAHHERVKSLRPEPVEGRDQTKFEFRDWFISSILLKAMPGRKDQELIEVYSKLTLSLANEIPIKLASIAAGQLETSGKFGASHNMYLISGRWGRC
jgi:hypothetical protein